MKCFGELSSTARSLEDIPLTPGGHPPVPLLNTMVSFAPLQDFGGDFADFNMLTFF